MKEAHVVNVPHGTPRIYAIGFVLSIILTAIPFSLVMAGALPVVALIPTIVLLAAVQIVVHLVCFLHLNRSCELAWNLTAFTYTLVVLVILV